MKSGLTVYAGLLAFLLAAPCCGFAAEDMLTDAPAQDAGARSQESGALAPGALILLPDGARTVIESVLPDGSFKTDAGIVVAPDGSVANSESKVEILMPGQPANTLAPGVLVALPDGRSARVEERLPDGDWKTDLGVILAQDGTVREKGSAAAAHPIKPEETQKSAAPEAGGEKRSAPEKAAVTALLPHEQPAENGEKQAQKAPATGAQAPDAASSRAPDQLTLAQMLPMTKLPEEKASAKSAQAKPENGKNAEKTPERKPQASAKKAEAPKKAPEQPAARKEEKKAPQKAAAKTAPGKELRIPPEAVKTGNLNFLEGCWQGTRPEYYSKRTIRECFCFGAGGANGKRRVYDPSGPRMCIGSTRAHLASNGVLSVTSSGAACDDGERWGQAEMQCKNSGPSTPCSWIFKDANNGRQAYQIPFVRVETCGR